MKPLMVLAGGFGTRLRSVVSDVPKPLAPVAGQPFIVHLIDHWVNQGVVDFIFLLHYEAEKIKRVLSELSGRDEFFGVTFRFVVETTPLGTGGAILNAIDYFGISEGFLVANADTWLSLGVRQLANSNCSAIVAVHVLNSKRYGSLKLEGRKKFVLLRRNLVLTAVGMLTRDCIICYLRFLMGLRLARNFD
jgi:D-glycero-alpha-D-manno-heptose 1-phosphate guanylyltransferase